MLIDFRAGRRYRQNIEAAHDQNRFVREQSCRVFVAAQDHVARESEGASRGEIEVAANATVAPANWPAGNQDRSINDGDSSAATAPKLQPQFRYQVERSEDGSGTTGAVGSTTPTRSQPLRNCSARIVSAAVVGSKSSQKRCWSGLVQMAEVRHGVVASVSP